MSNIVEIMDTTKICRNFPIEPQQEILRESFSGTVDDLFKKYSMVIVEGQDGIGKTTFLAQFAKRYPNNSISIFITPTTRSSYDPELIRIDLLSQVFWILQQKELESFENLDIKSLWGLNQIYLQRRAKTTRQTFYFIVDGLGEIPDSDSSYRELILDLLPLSNCNEFKFLISGNSDKLPKQIIEQISNKSFPISSYTLDDAYQNLADLNFSREDITELYKTFRLPGEFSTIRGLIQSGMSKEEFLGDMPLKAASLLDLEWKQVDLSNELLLKTIALVTFSTLKLSTNIIAEIIGAIPPEINKLLKSVPFLKTNDSEDIRFTSEAKQKYAQKKLHKYKNIAENQIMEFLKTSQDPKSMLYLPTIYDKAERYDELLSFLTPENFSLLLKANQSLIPLREAARLGVGAAHKLHRDSDLIGLGLQSAIVEELFSSDIWESEINALIALKEIQSALALIERAATKEDRLFLLSVLANAKEQHQLDIQGLDERIKNAYQQVDYQKLGDKAIDIAANLINFMPELAFDLVEKNTGSQDGENALDWAFAKLSIKAMAESKGDISSFDVVEKIQNKIKDPKAQNFMARGSLFYLNFSGLKIVAEAKNKERASEQLYLLRSWITKNREAQDAAYVVEFSLQIAITTTDYAPNARDFRELSTAIPYITDIERRKHLISVIDGQKGTIELLGPIEDYVRIMLILAFAEKDIDLETCRTRLIEAYLYTSELDELSTKSACLARISAALILIDPEKNFEEKDALHSTVNNDLDICIENLLNKTAEQYIVTKGIIRALAKTSPQKALEISKKLNNESRRNQAICDLGETTLDVLDNKLNLDFVKSCLSIISDRALKDELLIQVLARITAIAEDKIPNKGIIVYFINLIRDIQDAADKCNACCLGLGILNVFKSNEETLKNNIIELLTSTWDAMDIGWVKVDVGFKVVEALSDFSELSHNFFDKVENYRESIFLDSDATALTYLACSRLSVRAFSGLFLRKLDTENELSQVLSIIENIPSMTERTGLYTDLALRFRSAGREDKFSEIVKRKIEPTLAMISESDGLARELAIIAAVPALYLNHPIATLARIQNINFPSTRDSAYQAICSYILTKHYSEAYYDPAGKKGKKLSYDEIMDLINILEKIDSDTSSYSIISEITESVDNNRATINKNQRAEIARRLEQIASTKFPNKKYIEHHGYLLISLAQIYKIKDTVKQPEWDKLIIEAQKINIADQVLILSHIAECLPNKQSEIRKNIMADAENLIKDIPSVYDQINRYEILSHSTIQYDRESSQKYLKSGMDIAVKRDETDTLSAQRRLIDLAYKIDPDLAASFASIADEDPAREKTKNNIQKRYSQLKLKEKISKSENKDQEQNDASDDDYPFVAWMLLGSLNAGRITTKKFESVRDYAKLGANLSISQSYPIYSWLIENGIIRHRDTPQASEYLRPMFEATLTGCDLIISIAQKSTSQIKIAKSYIKDQPKNSTVIVDMNPDKAKSILTEWLKLNIKDELYIADRYFGLQELWILQVVRDINPNCKVYILTSKEHNKGISSPQDAYRDHWRLKISDEETPPTEVVIADYGTSRQSPIHDRWWTTGKAGIRIGTSTNSLGGNAISEIVELSIDEVSEREEIIKSFVFYKVREYKGEKIRYSSVIL